MDDLSTTPGIVALIALVLAVAALIVAVVLLVQVRRTRAAQRVVRATASSKTLSGEPPGGQMSSCNAMSEPNSPWTRIDSSGVNFLRAPSRCEENSKPFSDTLTRSAKEKA